MNHELKRVLVCIGAALAAAGPLAAHAAPVSVESEANVMDRDAAAGGEPRVVQRLSADFSAWAGSGENADALVYGLRHGSSVTLTGSAGDAVKFTPPTRPMGYGSVYISLALAKARLQAQGITEPTPLELQAALTGSAQARSASGVLQLRSDGMGWGRIAQTYGLKLGPVMADMKSAHQSFVATGSEASVHPPVTTLGGHAGGSADASSRGIVSAAGSAASGSVMHGLHGSEGSVGVNAAISTPAARGIVSAGGGLGLGNGGGLARGHFR